MLSEQKGESHDVAAIITAMTDREEPFLRETMAAVLSDPGIGQVILCIEDKNTWVDTTLDSLLADPRLKIIRMPLVSLGIVRNRALEHVQLPWVAYCDGDDVWCQGKTLTQRHYATATESDFVGADHFLTNETGKIRAVAIARYTPMPSAWMVRTEVMRQYPFVEVPFTLREEAGDWWLRTEGAIRKVRCPKLLLRYRIRSGSLSAQTSSMKRKTQIVSLANIPGLGAIIFLCTGFLWLLTRRKTYIWHLDWGEQPCAVSPERASQLS